LGVLKGGERDEHGIASKGPEATAMATCLYQARDERYHRLFELRDSFGVVSSTLSLYSSLSANCPTGRP
ncbi:MAG: hypothetical protein QXJ39_07315, partial [Candidatus Korarchaeum sp.]